MMEVVFKDKANARAGAKFVSLFPGLGYAAGESHFDRPALHHGSLTRGGEQGTRSCSGCTSSEASRTSTTS